MSTVNEMVGRVRELIVQAANDTNVHDAARPEMSDRQRIQDEINQLLDEIDATSLRTEFNTRQLLNGDLQRTRNIQAQEASGTVFYQVERDVFINHTSLSSLFNNSLGGGIGTLREFLINNHAVSTASLDSMLSAGGDLNITALGVSITALNEFAAAWAAGNNMATVNTWATLMTTNIFNGDGTVSGAGGVSAAGNFNLTQILQLDARQNPTMMEVVHRWAVDAGNAAAVSASLGTGLFPTSTVDQVSAAFANWLIGGPGVTGAGALQGLPESLHDELNLWVSNNSGVPFTGGLALNQWLSSMGTNGQRITITEDRQRNATTAELAAGVPSNNYADFSADPTAPRLERFITASVSMRVIPGRDAETIEGNALWFQIGANAGQGIHLNIESVMVNDLVSRNQFTDVLTRLNNSMADARGTDRQLYNERLNRLTDILVQGRAGFDTGLDFLRTVENGYDTGNAGIMQITGQDLTDILTVMDISLAHTTEQRSRLGAVQNRLEFTISNLDISSENLSASESRIRDADMAAEMMRFTQSNVLQQAAMSMLAQANQAPMQVLQLLN
jgi:flagellin